MAEMDLSVERPMLFQGPMVRAILDGIKTETRRLESNPQAARILPGDMLWVRETWTARMNGGWTIADARSRLYQEEILYQADGTESIDGWWPSIHMPREFSRILLRVTGVHIERLRDMGDQAITQDYARAEGIVEVREPDKDGYRHYSVRGMEDVIGTHQQGRWAYRALWDHINPHNPWKSDPMVRVIQFEKVKP